MSAYILFGSFSIYDLEKKHWGFGSKGCRVKKYRVVTQKIIRDQIITTNRNDSEKLLLKVFAIK